MIDTLENFKPMGWSGGGHLHWYTDEDPKGDKGCPRCAPYLKPGHDTLEQEYEQ